MYCLCTRCIIVNSVQVRSEFGKFVYTAICMRKCTLWSDNTCVFTRFHSIQNANTQLIWSSATCTKHLLNLDVLVWLFAFSCYTIHTSLKKWYLSMHRLACSLTNQKMAPWCGQVRGHSLWQKILPNPWPTYQILMISDNVEFVQSFWKWRPVEFFQCWDIIIYPHIKFWWYRTMLNFYAVFWQPFWKFYVSIIIHLEIININVRNWISTFP